MPEVVLMRENESSPAESEDLSEAAASPPAPPTPRLYSERRRRLTVWPAVIPQAEASERSVLAGRLRTLLQALEG
jgi:hypothetical protein